MKNTIRTFSLILVIFSLSACSIAPGIPGLSTSSSRYTKAQKEGVDYKLIIINAETIRKQKPFDFVAFIEAKKQRTSLYRSDAKINKSNNGVRSNNQVVINSIKSSNTRSTIKTDDRQLSRSEIDAARVLARFEGITSNDNKTNYQYQVGKGDVLNITVWDHPELTTPSENNAFGGHLVGSDGNFYFPYSGKIRATGKTVRAIRDELESKLGSFITKPQVSVSISNFRSQKIYTSGAVATPSTLMVNDRPTTVRDAISKSGGLRPKQYTGFATLSRNGKNISIDLDRMLKHNDNRQNFILKHGDRLNIVERTELDEFNRILNLDVRRENTLSSARLQNEIKSLSVLSPVRLKYELKREKSLARLRKELEKELRSEQAKVFVMGEVVRSGSVAYQIEDGMTLAEAINDAGSFREETVNAQGVFVIRKESDNDEIPTVYQLPIASVQSIFFAEQFNIRPRDIVYVTAAPSIRWNRIIGQLLPSLTLLSAVRR